MRLIDAHEYCKELKKEMEWPGRSQEFIDVIEVAVADLGDMPAVDAVVLPCKIGDEVWGVQKFHGKRWRAVKSTVSRMEFTDDMQLLIIVKNVCRGFWGDRVFATQEEAETEVGRMVKNATD